MKNCVCAIVVGCLWMGSWLSVAAVPSRAEQLPAPRWRIVATRYPTTDIVVAACTVQEFGAKGDGVSDDTAAFQAALKTMGENGGGTVFVPDGRYAIQGNLTVPATVTLRGDREKPSAGKPVRGTMLLAYAGRGDAEGKPLLSLKSNAGVKDLSIWYPQQDPAQIRPYPFTLQYSEIDTIEDVTLINSYQGIVGPVGSTYVIRNVYGTPLYTGIQIDNCYDTGRIENLRFSPDCWASSGLPGANGPHASWMLAHGTALRFFRIDWQCAAFIHIAGYKTGVEMLASKAGTSYGHFYGSAITHCLHAVSAVEARFPGFLFTDCLLEGDDAAVVTSAPFNSFLGFHSCTLRGKSKAVDIRGRSGLAALFHRCTLQGEVAQETGCLSLLGCTFPTPGNRITMGPGMRAATIAGCKYSGRPPVVTGGAAERVQFSSDSVPESKLPKVPPLQDKVLKPAKAALYVVTEGPWGAKKDAITDDTAAIQKAMDAAANNGGGIVFLPAGEYNVRGHLRVPSGVELRGIYDISHLCTGKGSALRFYAGRNDESAAPAIVMQRNSGLRGLTFLYPQQRYDHIVPFPYTVQGRGEGIYVVNIVAINSYKILDFMTYRCDRHCLDRVFGAPLKVGIAVGGGSVGGEVRDTNLNPGWWTLSPYADCPGTPDPRQALNGDPNKNPVVKYVMENLDAMVYGDCADELEFQGAICPSRYGVHFVSQHGRGAAGVFLAHASDSSQVTALFDGLGPAGVDFININLANYNPAEKRYCGDTLRAEARFYNMAAWGAPDYSAVVKSGSLVFELAHLNSYGPFVVNGGKLTLTNVLLSGSVPGGTALLVRNGGKVALTGNITPHGLRANSDAPPSAITARFEAPCSLPPKATGEGPVAAWTFAEGRGEITHDITGNGHDARIGNAQWKKIAQGNALAFSGSRLPLVVNTKGLPQFKAITVEAWVYPEQIGTAASLVHWDRRLELRINDQREGSRFACFVTFPDGSMEPRASGPVAEVNAWQHVVAVWDGAYLQLWVNGQQGTESERSGSLCGAPDAPLNIGWGFHGLIREVRLYNRPLAAEEIRTHYQRK